MVLSSGLSMVSGMRSDNDFEEYLDEAFEYLWNEIEPQAEDWDQTGNLPREELWSELQESGFLSARVPEEYGGLDLTHHEYIKLEKEWAKISGGLRVILHVHNLGADMITATGTEEQKERFLPLIANDGLSVAFALTEPHAGTGQDIKTTAEREGNKYIINGQKHHITNADFAEYINVVTRSENGFSNILVPRDAQGLSITSMPETMGSHGSHHAYLEFNDCEVPAENLLGKEGSGLEAAIESLRISRIYIAANALGISERCFEAALDWAKKRVTFGKPIAERQAIQEYLAEMARDVYVLQLAVSDAIKKVDERGTVGVEADLCKLLAMDVNKRVTDKAMLVFGGVSYYREFPIQRLYRDARLNWLEEGTPSIQKITAAKQLLNGKFPYEVDPFSARKYNLDEYDSKTGDNYTLSYELE
jgi:alkylation response protein AidB-like acyl-CoA dehydrogenase